jgi:hypothetical protein
MAEGVSQALGGCSLEVAEDVVDAAGVHPRMASRDTTSHLPALFSTLRPVGVVRSGGGLAHHGRIPHLESGAMREAMRA